MEPARPGADEFNEYYAGYVAHVAGGDVLAALARQVGETAALLAPLSEAEGEHRYAPEKWSIKEVVGHLADTERVFAYRALTFAREDPGPLPGMDQNAWVPAGRFAARTLAGLVAELEAVRAASLALFRGLDDEAWRRWGTASGYRVRARALPWIIAGHELHHRAILAERYL